MSSIGEELVFQLAKRGVDTVFGIPQFQIKNSEIEQLTAPVKSETQQALQSEHSR